MKTETIDALLTGGSKMWERDAQAEKDRQQFIHDVSRNNKHHVPTAILVSLWRTGLPPSQFYDLSIEDILCLIIYQEGCSIAMRAHGHVRRLGKDRKGARILVAEAYAREIVETVSRDDSGTAYDREDKESPAAYRAVMQYLMYNTSTDTPYLHDYCILLGLPEGTPWTYPDSAWEYSSHVMKQAQRIKH